MKRAGASLQLISIIALAACSVSDDDGVAPEAPVSLQTVLEFEGDVVDGVLTLRATGAADDARHQALTAIDEDRNGVRGTAVAANLVELTTENGNGFAAPGPVVDGCGTGIAAYDVFAGVRSFHTQRLQNMHLEIVSTSGGAAHALCNSDRASSNLVVGSTPLSSTLGLVRYGSLAPDPNGFATAPSSLVPLPRGTDPTARARRLRFKNPTGSFSFRGRIVADVCNDVRCAPGAAFVDADDVDSQPSFIDTDGDVNAVAEGNGVAWIGGTFSRVGRRTGAAFKADLTTTGTAKAWPSFEGGVVNAVVADAAGNVYVGGTFTHVGGVVRPRLARITASGVVDATFSPPVAVTSTDGVSALAIDAVDGRLWVGRTAAPFLSVVSTATGAPWATALPPVNDQVLALLIVGDDVFVGGRFTSGALLVSGKLARLSRTTATVSLGFPLVPFANNTTETVRALAFADDVLYVGGDFAAPRVNAFGVFNSGLLRDGTMSDWNPRPNGVVNDIEISGSTAYVGGAFTEVTSTVTVFLSTTTTTYPRVRLAALNLVEGTPSAFAPSPDGVVRSLAIKGTTLLVGGDFGAISNVARRRLAAVPANPATATPTPTTFDPAPGGGTSPLTVNAIAVVGNDVIAAGAFALGGGVPRSMLAGVSLASGELTSANVTVSGTSINALVQRTGQLFIGGAFTNVAGGARTNLAVIDATTLALNAFNANLNGTVSAMAVDDGNGVYVGGAFTSFGGVTHNRIARITSTTSVDTAFVGTSSATVNAVGATSDGVLLGSTSGLVRLNATGGAVSTLGVSAAGTVNAIVVAADRRNAWAGGTFTAIGGASRVNLAKVNLRTNTVDPAFSRAGISGGAVFALDVDGPALVVGGAFTAPRNRLAVVDVDSGNLLAAEPISSVGVDVRAVRQTGTVVVAGGSYGNGAVLDIVGVDGGARRSSVVAFFGEGEAETPGSEPVPSSGAVARCRRPMSRAVGPLCRSSSTAAPAMRGSACPRATAPTARGPSSSTSTATRSA